MLEQQSGCQGKTYTEWICKKGEEKWTQTQFSNIKITWAETYLVYESNMLFAHMWPHTVQKIYTGLMKMSFKCLVLFRETVLILHFITADKQIAHPDRHNYLVGRHHPPAAAVAVFVWWQVKTNPGLAWCSLVALLSCGVSCHEKRLIPMPAVHNSLGIFPPSGHSLYSSLRGWLEKERDWGWVGGRAQAQTSRWASIHGHLDMNTGHSVPMEPMSVWKMLSLPH